MKKAEIPTIYYAIYDDYGMATQRETMAIFESEDDAKRILKHAKSVVPDKNWRIVPVLITEIRKKK